jgi:hypothetical protein
LLLIFPTSEILFPIASLFQISRYLSIEDASEITGARQAPREWRTPKLPRFIISLSIICRRNRQSGAYPEAIGRLGLEA